MTKETEESIKVMANTANHHAAARSTGVTADYFRHYLETMYDEGFRDGVKAIESLPWEYHFVAVPSNEGQTGVGAAALNLFATLGWEPILATDGRILCRRRKGVSDES